MGLMPPARRANIRTDDQRGELPDDIPERRFEGVRTLVDALVAAGFAESKRAAQRLIAEGAVKIDGSVVTDPKARLGPDRAAVLAGRCPQSSFASSPRKADPVAAVTYTAKDRSPGRSSRVRAAIASYPYPHDGEKPIRCECGWWYTNVGHSEIVEEFQTAHRRRAIELVTRRASRPSTSAALST